MQATRAKPEHLSTPPAPASPRQAASTVRVQPTAAASAAPAAVNATTPAVGQELKKSTHKSLTQTVVFGGKRFVCELC